jgi:hypothetical protein
MIAIVLYSGGQVETVYIPDDCAEVPLYELAATNKLLTRDKIDCPRPSE